MSLLNRRNTPAGMAKMIAWSLEGDRPKSLRALSFSLTAANSPVVGKVELRAHFFRPPSEEEIEAMSILETELISNDPDNFEYLTKVAVEPIGTKLRPREHMAWIDSAEAFRKK